MILRRTNFEDKINPKKKYTLTIESDDLTRSERMSKRMEFDQWYLAYEFYAYNVLNYALEASADWTNDTDVNLTAKGGHLNTVITLTVNANKLV